MKLDESGSPVLFGEPDYRNRSIVAKNVAGLFIRDGHLIIHGFNCLNVFGLMPMMLATCIGPDVMKTLASPCIVGGLLSLTVLTLWFLVCIDRFLAATCEELSHE